MRLSRAESGLIDIAIYLDQTVTSYRQVYIELLAETNPRKLATLRDVGRLEAVLATVESEMTDEELRLTRAIARESLGGRDLTGPEVTYIESVQALNQARISAREVVTQRLTELARAGDSRARKRNIWPAA